MGKNTIYDIVINKIFEIMETGTAPWRAGWLNKQINGFTNKPYRGFNILNLSFSQYANGYDAPVWLTWKQISQLGGSVKKGSRTAEVFFASVVEKANKDNDEIEEVEEKTERYFLWRYYRVFNLDCVTGIDKSKWLKSHQDLESPEEIVKKWATECPIEFGGSTQAYYAPIQDRIVVPHKSLFGKIEDYYSVCFHEITHSTGHEKRLNRPLGMMKEEYSFEELVAELGSAFLCTETGVEPNYSNSASYIKGWSEFFKENKKQMILQACSQATKAVEFVIKNSLKTKKEEAI